MKPLRDFYSFNSFQREPCVFASASATSADAGYSILTYAELLEKIASIRFHNPELQLLYRGQRKDYALNASGEQAKISSLYPSIFRNHPEFAESKIRPPDYVRRSYDLLENASDNLIKNAEQGLTGTIVSLLRKHRLLRWAIIQHYEIVDTPLLDVSPSLDVALSFAANPASGFLYVIGLPMQTDILTSSIVESTQSISLPQFCPPGFLRPHFQNGFLIGEYPPVENYQNHTRGESRGKYNFSQRLVAKFKIMSFEQFQESGFSKLNKSILMPENDSFLPISAKIKSAISDEKKQLKSDLLQKRT